MKIRAMPGRTVFPGRVGGLRRSVVDADIALQAVVVPTRRGARFQAIALAVGIAVSQLATASGAGAQSPKQFGVVTDPAHFGAWAAAIGATPTLDMEFQAWSRPDTIANRLATARSQGATAYMVTWEPWDPVPAALGREAQYAVQPAYSNPAIAAGAWDDYIR